MTTFQHTGRTGLVLGSVTDHQHEGTCVTAKIFNRVPWPQCPYLPSAGCLSPFTAEYEHPLVSEGLTPHGLQWAYLLCMKVSDLPRATWKMTAEQRAVPEVFWASKASLLPVSLVTQVPISVTSMFSRFSTHVWHTYPSICPTHLGCTKVCSSASHSPLNIQPSAFPRGSIHSALNGLCRGRALGFFKLSGPFIKVGCSLWMTNFSKPQFFFCIVLFSSVRKKGGGGSVILTGRQ